VVDGMKLTPKNPSFLTVRNAILKAFATQKGKAIGTAEYPAVQRAAWSAFAKFGMGVDASLLRLKPWSFPPG
jgi:extracellular elastinolytic metalloproteinase